MARCLREREREREREGKDMRAKWNEILKKSDRAENRRQRKGGREKGKKATYSSFLLFPQPAPSCRRGSPLGQEEAAGKAIPLLAHTHTCAFFRGWQLCIDLQWGTIPYIRRVIGDGEWETGEREE